MSTRPASHVRLARAGSVARACRERRPAHRGPLAPVIAGREPARIELWTAFTEHGLTDQLTQIYGSGSDTRRQDAATWPIWEPCFPRGGIPLLDEQSALVTGALALVHESNPMTSVGVDGSQTPAELTVALKPQSACFSPAYIASLPTEKDLVNVLAEVTLTSSALPGPVRFPAQLVGTPRAGALDVQSVALTLGVTPCTQAAYDPEEFVAQCGDWRVDLSGYTAASLEIIEARFDAWQSFVNLHVRGYRYPGCGPTLNGFMCDEGSRGELEVSAVGAPRIFALERSSE